MTHNQAPPKLSATSKAEMFACVLGGMGAGFLAGIPGACLVVAFVILVDCAVTRICNAIITPESPHE